MENNRQLSHLEHFICTVGFPIVAFFTMVYVCIITIEKNTEALNRLTVQMESMKYVKKTVKDNPSDIVNR